MRSNSSATFMLFIFGLLAHFLPGDIPLDVAWKISVEAFPSAFIFAYLFDIMQQPISVEEDTINKPHRPIPAGLLTINSAKFRWFLSWTFFPLIINLVSGQKAMVYALSWQAWCWFCYVWPKFNNPLFRSLFVSVGIFPMFGWLHEIVYNHTQRTCFPFQNDLILAT